MSLGLCTQIDLDSIVKKAADKKAKLEAKTQEETGESLKPVEKTVKETDTNQPKVEHTLESLFKPSKI